MDTVPADPDGGIHHSPAVQAVFRIAVLVPCHNEATTIAGVVRDFRATLPACIVHVCDNNSTDGTAAVARKAGAVVHAERRQGKGNVVRRMFADIDADCYLLVDGDGTYDATVAPAIAARVLTEGYDLVNVARTASSACAYRSGHVLGNRLLTGLVRLFFGRDSEDMLSGYKALSRRFVKSFPATSEGFEIETELMVHALELRLPITEVSAPYHSRPEGSSSKLRTYRDGMRILWLISRLVKDERPLQFFGSIGLALCLLALVIAVPVLATYMSSGLVPRIPTAVLCVGMVLLGWLCIFSGIILDVVTKARREMKQLRYLSLSPVIGPACGPPGQA